MTLVCKYFRSAVNNASTKTCVFVRDRAFPLTIHDDVCDARMKLIRDEKKRYAGDCFLCAGDGSRTKRTHVTYNMYAYVCDNKDHD